MNILVLNGHSLHKRFDLPGLFKSHAPEAKVTMVCSSRHGHGTAKNRDGYEDVHVLEDYDFNPDVDRIAGNLCRQGDWTVVAGNERDILSAARLRTRFDFSGQKEEQALLFRDKLHMKEFARKAGFEVPESAALSSPADAYAFADRSGFPLIIKPRRRAGALGVMRVEDEEQMTAALKRIFLAGKIGRDLGTEYEIERAVEGEMYSVNGYVLSGGAGVYWPNRVKGSWLGLANSGESVFDAVMEAGAPEAEELVRFARGLLSSFGLTNSVFHLEAFIESKTRRVVLCEVACRAPGLLIGDCWKKMFGLDLDEVSFLLQSGLGIAGLARWAEEFDPAKRLAPAVGYLSIPCRGGLVLRAPKPVFEGVEFEKFVVEGSRYSRADQINTLAVLALLQAEDARALSAKAEALAGWYAKEVVWGT